MFSGMLLAVLLAAWGVTQTWPYVALAMALVRGMAQIHGRAPTRTLRLLSTLYHELSPFYLPSVFIINGLAMALGRFDSADDWIGFGAQLAAWFFMRNLGDDDDRWKRRRRKAAEKIIRVGGRLVVIPAPAPAR